MRTTNLFIIRGYVGQDPKSFGKTAKVSIATKNVWWDQKGQRREDTEWVTVSILNEKVATWVTTNVKKGDPVYAECRVKESSYEKNGERVYTTDVIATLFDSLVPSEPEGN